jgi:hypothetical protein
METSPGAAMVCGDAETLRRRLSPCSDGGDEPLTEAILFALVRFDPTYYYTI